MEIENSWQEVEIVTSGDKYINAVLGYTFHRDIFFLFFKMHILLCLDAYFFS